MLRFLQTPLKSTLFLLHERDIAMVVTDSTKARTMPSPKAIIHCYGCYYARLMEEQAILVTFNNKMTLKKIILLHAVQGYTIL